MTKSGLPRSILGDRRTVKFEKGGLFTGSPRDLDFWVAHYPREHDLDVGESVGPERAKRWK